MNDQIRLLEKVINMVISKATIRANTFSPKASKFFVTGQDLPLSKSLCAMKGFFYSVRPGLGQILLNMNLCTSAFFNSVLVPVALHDHQLGSIDEDRHHALKGIVVRLTYKPKNVTKEMEKDNLEMDAVLTKTIRDFGEPCWKQTFTDSNGQMVTVQAYFKSSK